MNAQHIADVLIMEAVTDKWSSREAVIAAVEKALAAPKEAGDDFEALITSLYGDLCDKPIELSHAYAERIRRLAAPSKEAGPELFPGTYESLSKLSIRQENPDEL